MAIKLYDENSIKSIANAIREKAGTETTYKTSEMPGGIDEVYEAGKQAEYDKFWDEYQKKGKKNDFNSAFRGWSDELYKPKYPIVCNEISNGSVSEYMFYQSQVKDTRVDITLPKNQTFKQGFFGCFWLVTIKKLIIDDSTKFSNSFAYCQHLVNLTIEGVIGQKYFDLSYSKELSKESIISVINALSTETSGYTVTFSKTSINNAFGIDVDDITTYGPSDKQPEGRNEYWQLRQSKSNWTFNYS